MKPDGSGVADCMKMKEVSVMNVEKKKKKPPPRWKEAHPDNRTKLQLVWARLCLVGNLSSTPRPAPPPPSPPPGVKSKHHLAGCVWLRKYLSALLCERTYNGLWSEAGERGKKEKKKKKVPVGF